MADWKTYAKAARNTARKQAPEVKRSAQETARRGSRRAGEYARAAGRVVEESRRDDVEREADRPRERRDRPEPEDRREYDPRPEQRDDESSGHRPEWRDDTSSGRRPEQRDDTSTERRPAVDTDRLRREAVAYYTVAERRVRGARLGPRIMRAVRDALLIGLSILAIWLVLSAAGLPIPLSAVLIVVGVIVLVSFGTSLYASSRRARRADDDEGDDRDG